MQKKLLAVAVAGALGAPAVALAQTSTVQLFGTMYIEYTVRADQGLNAARLERSDADFLQTPGSEVGFKGEEKLGGGLSAWFQCASTADPRAQSQEGWCSRNSALGLKGGFGNVFIGNWDAPFKRTISPTNVGGNDTGIFGTAFLLTGGSTTTSFPGQGTAAIAGTVTSGSAGRGIFKRRQNSSINYDSPSFAGFQVMAMFTAAQNSTATLDAANNSHARILSLGAQYSAGPLYVGAGYERHKDANGATGVPVTAASAREGDDDAWHIGVAYTWGPVRVGGQYTRQELEFGTVGAPAEVTFKAWHVGVDWRIVGPHGLRAAFTRARDSSASGVAAGGANLVGSGIALTSGTGTVAASGVVRPIALPGAASDNGAKLYQIRYVYTFSKRTEFNVGYVRLENDNNGTYALGGLPGGPANLHLGQEQDAFAFSLRHTF